MTEISEIAVVKHADWCSISWGRECDCGGNEGRCPICDALGPCAFLDDGTPLICRSSGESMP